MKRSEVAQQKMKRNKKNLEENTNKQINSI